jgi:hypothetical protein
VDQGSLQTTLKSLAKHNIVCSIIGLSAEVCVLLDFLFLMVKVYVCGQICKETHGTYRVSMNENHFTSLLMEHIHPPPVFDSKTEEMSRDGFIEIGFPTLILKLDDANAELPLCFW